jgi:Flp pilus assembly protein TadG
MNVSNVESNPGRRVRNARGVALIEFAISLPVLIIMAFGIIDFGRLIQARIIVSNLAREGGSIASRDGTIDGGDANLITMIQSSGRPLNLTGGDGKVIITRLEAGKSASSTNPTVSAQLSGGSLSVGSAVGAGKTNLGLSNALYNHLVFKTANSASDISEITIVEVIYKYRPVTPLSNFVPDLLTSDNGGLIIRSKSIF